MTTSEQKPKCYLVTVRLKSETPSDRINDIPLVMEWLLRFTGSQHEVAFSSKDGTAFGYFFKPAADIQAIAANRIRGDFDSCRGTRDGDAMMIVEVGKLVQETGFSRAGTWLQRH